MVPNELLHYIIVQVVADSIHAICVAPGDVEWEMCVLPTLCGVSYTFRTITLGLIKQAFRKTPEPPGNISSLFLPIKNQLKRLRLCGNRLHRVTSGPTTYFEPQPDDAVLISGYSLFVAAMDLRFNCAGSHPIAFYASQEIIVAALSLSLTMCPNVQPRGLANVLSDAMRKQMDLVQAGLDIVRITEVLIRLVGERIALEDSEEEDVELQRVANLKQIREEIEKLEQCFGVYAGIVESDPIYRTSELPLVLSIIDTLQLMEVDGEFPFATWPGQIVSRWTTIFDFSEDSAS